MTREHQPSPASLFTQVQVSQSPQTSQALDTLTERSEHTRLLREILAAQDRQNELLEELVSILATPQRQRANELNQWKQANPRLSKRCRAAAEALSRVQTEFLDSLTTEVSENIDTLIDGEFMLNEFVDRFGPRLAHLNGVLQVLSHLSAAPTPPETTE